MNDEELTTVVKESVTGAHLDVPVERIVSRSQAIRGRRRATGASGALAVAAAAALAVTTLLPASQPAHTKLAAWTVAKQANGDIAVTIRKWHDLTGLQRALRADGLPVIAPSASPGCRVIPVSLPLRKSIGAVSGPIQRHGQPMVMVLHPAAVPAGLHLSLSVPQVVQPLPATSARAKALRTGQVKMVPADNSIGLSPRPASLPFHLVRVSPQCPRS